MILTLLVVCVGGREKWRYWETSLYVRTGVEVFGPEKLQLEFDRFGQGQSLMGLLMKDGCGCSRRLVVEKVSC